jgi:hypothetical protein
MKVKVKVKWNQKGTYLSRVTSSWNCIYASSSPAVVGDECADESRASNQKKGKVELHVCLCNEVIGIVIGRQIV